MTYRMLNLKNDRLIEIKKNELIENHKKMMDIMEEYKESLKGDLPDEEMYLIAKTFVNITEEIIKIEKEINSWEDPEKE